MKIIIPGGSGHLGAALARWYQAAGHEVVVLSRDPQPMPWRVAAWDAMTPGSWTEELEGADVVINLAGRSVNCRYNAANRKAIMDSRVQSTRVVGQAIAAASSPPRIWLQASTATIYAHRYDAANDESTGIIGGSEPGVPETWRFSIEVARAWEAAVDEAMTPRTRKVKLRAAVVMSTDPDGAFDILLGLVRHGVGGQAANGRQYVSWIHTEDFIRALNWIIEHDDLDGAINVCAPNPLPNAAFMKALRQAWGIQLGLPATKGMLEIAVMLLKSETELILKSRRVVPQRLLQDGFTFNFPDWPAAAEDLCRKWREAS